MSLNKINKITGDKTLVAGGTLFADNPIGTILPYGGTEAPRGWFLCQGQEISRTTYKDLFDIIGTAFGSGDDSTTFNLPDFRESVPVGAGENSTATIADHDTYTVGEFKDDQVQDFSIDISTEGTNTNRITKGSNTQTGVTTISEISSNIRSGTTTHGKQLGVNYIIKALMIGIPIDFAGSILLDELGNVNIDDQTLSNGQALVYDSTTGKWVNGESVGVSSLVDLTDTNINLIEWSTKTWSGLTNFRGGYIWSDGVNVYYSRDENQYVLDKSTSTWLSKTWTGLTNFNGESIWSDGTNIYYSQDNTQYVLDVSTSTWSTKTWTGLTEFYGTQIWSDGDNIYYSNGSNQYVLDKSTSTWSTKTWLGLSQTDLSNFNGDDIWTDGENVYYSHHYSGVGCQYVLDKSTSTWSPKTWSGLTEFKAKYIWSDGANIYYSGGTFEQFVLDKSTSTWLPKTWSGWSADEFYATDVWTDGNNIYCSRDTRHHKQLNRTEEALIYDWDNQKWINKEIVSKEDIPKTFTGTQAEWDALTTSEKLTYEQVNITDDESDPSVVVDAVTDGDMHAVTSNAVADKFSSLGQKYVSADVNVSETSWTSKTFTFNTNIPKGKYLIGAKFTMSGITQSSHCVIAGLTYISFVSGYTGGNLSTTTSEIYTQDTDGTVSISYDCAITVNNPVIINLVLIRIG